MNFSSSRNINTPACMGEWSQFVLQLWKVYIASTATAGGRKRRQVNKSSVPTSVKMVMAQWQAPHSYMHSHTFVRSFRYSFQPVCCLQSRSRQWPYRQCACDLRILPSHQALVFHFSSSHMLLRRRRSGTRRH